MTKVLNLELARKLTERKSTWGICYLELQQSFFLPQHHNCKDFFTPSHTPCWHFFLWSLFSLWRCLSVSSLLDPCFAKGLEGEFDQLSYIHGLNCVTSSPGPPSTKTQANGDPEPMLTSQQGEKGTRKQEGYPLLTHENGKAHISNIKLCWPSIQPDK